MPGIASAATVVVIAHIAGGTKTIRVGAGGIMLPNHAPLVVAEQFGTLESLFPGRIDLGLGRAPGTDHATAVALRRTLASHPDAFPQDVVELIGYFEARGETGEMRDAGRATELGWGHPRTVRAIPGAGLRVPIVILGSSLFGAQVAAAFGLPFAFASHFAAQQLVPAVEIYRASYKPSAEHPHPYVILGINVVAADTDDDARFIASSGRQAMASLRAGVPIQLPPPSREWERDVIQFDPSKLETLQSVSLVGSPTTVNGAMEAVVERMQPDELIVTSHIYDHAVRLHSYEIVSEL